MTIGDPNSSKIYIYSYGDTAIGAGSKVIVAPFGKLGTSTLTIAGTSNTPTGTLDLGNSHLNIRNGDIAVVSSQLRSGFNNGTWTGKGIMSSVAAADSTHLTAIGAILNNNGTGGQIYGNNSSGTIGNNFDGDNPGITSVLLKVTYYGDSNLDGVVDGSDYSRIDNGFLNHLSGWYNGDYNYDGSVNGSDYTLIDNAFNNQAGNFAPNGVLALANSSGSMADAVAQFNASRLTASLTASNAAVGSTGVTGINDIPNPSASTTAEIASSAAVPEPASLGLIGVAAVSALARRRRVAR